MHSLLHCNYSAQNESNNSPLASIVQCLRISGLVGVFTSCTNSSLDVTLYVCMHWRFCATVLLNSSRSWFTILRDLVFQKRLMFSLCFFIIFVLTLQIFFCYQVSDIPNGNLIVKFDKIISVLSDWKCVESDTSWCVKKAIMKLYHCCMLVLQIELTTCRTIRPLVIDFAWSFKYICHNLV